MRARPADILAIDRLAAPHLTIAEFDAARGRIGLIQHLVMGGHHALQRCNIDAHDQTAPGGGTGNARTTGLQALNQLGVFKLSYSTFAQISEQIIDAVWTLFAEAKTADSHRSRHAAVR